MQYPAKKMFAIPVLALCAVLTACGSDKPETLPAKEPAKTAPATQAAPAEQKAEVVKEPAQPAKADEPATKEAPAAKESAAPVKALSIAEGKKRYEQTCRVCHDQGLLDAPKFGDKAEWVKRLEKGVDTLHQHSAKGYNKMPAQATGQVSEAEVYAAVDYMVESSK